MKRNKLKSFTIMEVIIVMMISVIVIGIAYLAFSIVNKQLIRYKTDTGKINDVLLLNRMIRKDFANSDQVFKTDNGFKCTTDSTLIEYTIDDSIILRSSTTVDSVKVQTIELTCYFEGVKVEEANKLVDKVTLNIMNDKRTIFIGNEKLYDVKSLMKMGN